MAEVTKNWFCEPKKEVIVQIGKEGTSALPPRTIPEVFKESCSKFGSNKMLNVKREGEWQSITTVELYQQCMRVAKSLVAIGLKRFEAVSIMGFNSPEWMMGNLGTIMAGGLATGIFTTNNVQTTRYILENSRSRVAIGENSQILEKLLEAGKGVEEMKFVQYSPAPIQLSQRERGVISWDEFLQLGKYVKTEDLEAIMSAQRPGHCCTLIYTSGTTGMPKGVMLSHDNMLWDVLVLQSKSKIQQSDTLVSYLAFSHTIGRIRDFYTPLISGCKLYISQPHCFNTALLDSIKEVEPSLFIGMPHVWELMYEKVEPEVKAGRLQLHEVKKTLGLNKARIFTTGGATTPLQILKFFESADIPICNVYGATETSGAISRSTPGYNRLGAAGLVIEGIEVKIHNPNSVGEGEVLTKGRNNFIGYLRNPEKTAEVLDSDGWYHTGDIGRFDSEGYLWITGRIKEMLVIGSGQNVAPVPIEMEMKKELKLCAFCVVVGEAREYFNMLVTIKSKLSPEGAPTDTLDEEAVAICKSIGVGELTKVSEVMESLEVKKYIQEGINRANERAMNHQCIIKNFAILPLNFTINTGELTPTGKLKRSSVVSKYADVIGKMYS